MYFCILLPTFEIPDLPDNISESFEVYLEKLTIHANLSKYTSKN